MKMKFNLKHKWPNYEGCCLVEGMMLCCGTTVDIVGVTGTLLLLSGIVEIAAGVYFMLTLPMFDIASNIWTGILTGFVGAVLMYYGSTNQTRRRSYLILTLAIMSLVANIVNLVIVQAGENNAFLSKNILKIIEIRDKTLQKEVAVWLTTATSAIGVVCSFFVAQLVFCSQLRPKFKKTITLSESHKRSFDANRFFPPSRLVGTKTSGGILPSIVPLPDHASASTTAAWVYSPDDKLSSGLYPMALDMHTDIFDGSRRPIRHSSFAAPRYARVVQRPQRAQSFATRRDPFSLHGEEFPRLQPVAVPQLPRTFGNERRLRRSSSFTAYASDAAATLSRKYRAFSLCKNDTQILEVGNLLDTVSEHSLANALTDAPISGHFMEVENECSVSRSESLKEKKQLAEEQIRAQIRRLVHRHKGPAPQPPLRRDSSIAGSEEEKITMEAAPTQEYPEIEEDPSKYCTCSESCDEKEAVSDEQTVSPQYIRKVGSLEFQTQQGSPVGGICASTSPNLVHRSEGTSTLDDNGSSSPIYESPKLMGIIPSEIEPVKLPPLSLLKEIAQNTHFWNTVKNSKSSKYQKFDTLDWKKLENFLKIILEKSETKIETSTPTPQSVPSKPEPPQKFPRAQTKHLSNNYEEAHKEVTKNYSTLIERLPSTEVQRNKIILRVPSFKNTGCQTEAYRPIRRRASCSQGPVTNSTPSSKYFSVQGINKRKPLTSSKGIEVQLNGTTCSSSSGYSSPDGDSKGGSPMHSGPPSPGSVPQSALKNNPSHGANVTIIEVNRPSGFRNSSMIINPPPRPPKPMRMRYYSDASMDLKRIVDQAAVHQYNPSKSNFQNYEDTFGFTTLAENMMLLAEAINPILVHGNQNNTGTQTVPRVVDVIHKKSTDSVQSRLSRSESLVQGHRTSMSDSNPQLLRMNSLTLPRVQTNFTRSRLPDITSRSPSPQEEGENEVDMNKNFIDSSSTAAYLTSLELLATHYKQKALANAKQLQLQQHLLVTQNASTEMPLSTIDKTEEMSNSSAELDTDSEES